MIWRTTLFIVSELFALCALFLFRSFWSPAIYIVYVVSTSNWDGRKLLRERE